MSDCFFHIAYVIGVVLLDGITNDEMESKALINAVNLVDIYSGSWGPKDDGKMCDGPGVLAQMAFEIGATTVIVKYINNFLKLIMVEYK